MLVSHPVDWQKIWLWQCFSPTDHNVVIKKEILSYYLRFGNDDSCGTCPWNLPWICFPFHVGQFYWNNANNNFYFTFYRNMRNLRIWFSWWIEFLRLQVLDDDLMVDSQFRQLSNSFIGMSWWELNVNWNSNFTWLPPYISLKFQFNSMYLQKHKILPKSGIWFYRCLVNNGIWFDNFWSRMAYGSTIFGQEWRLVLQFMYKSSMCIWFYNLWSRISSGSTIIGQ